MKILIVDDELRPAQLITGILEKNYPTWEKPRIAQNMAETFQLLQQESIDLLFLDVEMPEMSGFDLLENLNLKRIPAIIFITAHHQYAAKAFRVNAVDYLLKPILTSQLLGAVEKARVSIAEPKIPNTSPKITVYEGQSYHIVLLDNLVRAEADGSYTQFILANGQRLISSKQLKFYETLLEKHRFIRCHKSHLVNLDYIRAYTLSDGGYLNLTNDERIPLAISKKRMLLDRLELS